MHKSRVAQLEEQLREARVTMKKVRGAVASALVACSFCRLTCAGCIHTRICSR